MYGQNTTENKHIRSYITRKVKTSMMHILDLFKASVSHNKVKKAKATKSKVVQRAESMVMKTPLTRKLTQGEINDAELALKRLQAEKKRLEDLLNAGSDRHLQSQYSHTSSYSNSCEDVSTNNNVRKELVRVPRYQQKVAFILHDVFTSEVSITFYKTSSYNVPCIA